MYITGVGVGDILAVRGSGVPGEAIRFGSALIDLPNMEAHICGVHHQDKAGVLWGIEARPGGVGWRDCADYLNSIYTITNRNQPKTPEQRVGITAYLESMLGTNYDWEAIGEDGLRDLHLDDIWHELKWQPPQGGTALSPAHVVCSSLLAYGYKKYSLDYPQLDQSGNPLDPRNVQPADWTALFLEKHYT